MNDRRVLELRGPKAQLDPQRAYAAVWEEEPDATGALASTAVVLLTNHECPFRCVMCDLWVNTLDAPVGRGAIPAQIRGALAGLPSSGQTGPRQIKLYNAGSFFDPQAIPPDDDPEIAEAVRGFDRVIVESHPAFLAGAYGERCLRFRELLAGPLRGPRPTTGRPGLAKQPRLEVAIGLETAHEPTLERLNKRMTLDSFGRAAAFLAGHDIDLRVFILLNPPFLRGQEAVEWACRSIDAAVEAGAAVCSVIPTRGGNGVMEALGADVERPGLPALERVVEYGLRAASAKASASAVATADKPASQAPMRVFADLWDVERFFDCECSRARASRLRAVNRFQRVTAAVPACTAAPSCGRDG